MQQVDRHAKIVGLIQEHLKKELSKPEEDEVIALGSPEKDDDTHMDPRIFGSPPQPSDEEDEKEIEVVNVDEEGKKEEEEEKEQECIPEMARDAASLRALKEQLEHVHQQKLMKQEESSDSSKYVDSSDSDWKPASGDYGSDELYSEDEGTDEGEDESTDKGEDEGTNEGKDEGTDEGEDEGTDEGKDEGTDESEDEGTDEGEDEHEADTEVQSEAEGEDDGDSEIEEIEYPTKKEPKQEQPMKVKAQVKGKKGKATKVTIQDYFKVSPEVREKKGMASEKTKSGNVWPSSQAGGKKRKASEMTESEEKEKEEEGEQVKSKPKKKRAKQQKIKCPKCEKPLVKCRKTHKCHYDTFHASVTNDVREEQIEIVMKKSMPLRLDGTCSSDPPGHGVRTVKDGRIRRRTCMYVLWKSILLFTFDCRPPEFAFKYML